MSLSDREQNELHELLEALLEQTMTDEQGERLARMLKESDEARQCYVRYLGLSASLHHYAGLTQTGPVTSAPMPSTRATVSWRQIGGRYALALSACLVLAGGAWIWFNGRTPPGPAADRPVVEVVVGELEVESAGTTQPVAEHMQLHMQLNAGDRVRVPANALAVLRYADATVVELRSDTVVRLGEPDAGENPAKVLALEQGTLFAEVQPQRQSMVILTPNARARVLGTRFLLSAAAGETRLDVQRGKVQFAPLKHHQSVDVIGGHVAVAKNGTAQPSVQISRAPVAPVNLVQNPSFELEPVNGKAPHWGRQQQARLDRSVSHGGAASLKVVGPSAFSYVWQSIALEPETRYRLSVWIKTEGVSGKDGVRARYSQIEPTTITWRSPPIRGTSDWVLWQTEFRTPADYCCGRLDLTWELNDGETAWFDDVELVKIDPADAKR